MCFFLFSFEKNCHIVLFSDFSCEIDLACEIDPNAQVALITKLLKKNSFRQISIFGD